MVEEVQESQGPGVLKSQGPKDQDISKSHSNTSLTLKKVHLVKVSKIALNGILMRCRKHMKNDPTRPHSPQKILKIPCFLKGERTQETKIGWN